MTDESTRRSGADGYGSPEGYDSPYGYGNPYGSDAPPPAHAAPAASPAWPSPPPYAPGPAPEGKRARGPMALLAAVALVAAAVGGGTAYAFQELAAHSDSASAQAGTPVVTAGKKGTVAAVAAAVSPSVVQVDATLQDGSSTGSGVVVTDGGEIITNNHVVSGASSVTVRTSDGKSYTADVVGTDSSKDLALLKVSGASGLKAATLGDSSDVRVGDTVVAIGSPEGLSGTVTSGIVSALNRDVTVSTDEDQSQGQGGQQDGDGDWPFQFGGREFNGDTGSSTTTYKAIQTDASLNPGNSGGALFDASGRVIGINSAMYSSGSRSSSSSDAGSIGLGFAIPVNTVKSDLAKLRAGSTD
ncbi:S1C family serine protease [Streptomyces sp. LaPpAH-108]|uniref:S1C family serine protease n=1 Tax=Streptomyces sp. LaPpAH-108 TaxID=1155714 RepID=UPI00035DB62F|nr:trypsin-like peptidase domain-containing protein [Streptomyces sp. LaPpAH-108]